MGRINKEKQVISLMVKLYCNANHKTKTLLCDQCEEVLAYARERLSNCKFGEKKSSCGRCPIRCYKSEMRDKIKLVMKFSGPRILFYRPIEFLKHTIIL